MQLKTRLFKLFAFAVFVTFIVSVVTYRYKQIPALRLPVEDKMMLSAANTAADIAMDTNLLSYGDTVLLTTVMSSSKSMTVIDPAAERRRHRIAAILARQKSFALWHDSSVDYKPKGFLQADSAWLRKLPAADTNQHH